MLKMAIQISKEEIEKHYCFTVDHSLAIKDGRYSGQDLSYVDFTSLEQVTQTDFSNCNLTGAKFKFLRMCNCNFSDAILHGAIFTGANLAGSMFRRAQLRSTSFMNTSLTDVDFAGCNLRYAIFDGAFFNYTKFDNCKLHWSSHKILAEILSRGCPTNNEVLKLAGLVQYRKDYCWGHYDKLDIDPAAKLAAVKMLLPYAEVESEYVPCTLVRIFAEYQAAGLIESVIDWKGLLH